MASWNIDKNHTAVEFVATHMMFTKVRGKFEALEGTISYDPANVAASKVNVTIDASSITTGVGDRDNHLKSPDFLDVANFPTLTFVSTKVEPTGDGKAKVTGDLTIRGTTRSVTLDATFEGTGKNPWGVEVAGFSGTTKINREDWGLTWNAVLETGGLLVSKDVQINLEVQAALQPEAVTA
jgi:polyisoprenoid-binding protein YceI